MRHFLLTLVLLLWTVTASAQVLVYNPTRVRFEHADFATTQYYTVSVIIDGDTLPFSMAQIPRDQVTDVGNGSYDIPFARLPKLPAGKSYRLQITATNASGTGPTSNVTPEAARFSTCVTSTGSISPMRITVNPLPTLLPRTLAVISITIQSPNPVHNVVVDFIGDGLPAWSFYAPNDLRTTQSYTIGPLPRVGTYLISISASDEQGCQTTAGDVFATVR